MTFRIERLSKQKECLWDEFSEASINSSFQHTRRFLNYHRDRFVDVSIFIFYKNKLVGLFPVAEDPECRDSLVSHPGATYGGVVHQGRLVGEKMIQAVNAIKQYYRDLGYKKIKYKVLPYIYASVPAQDDLYALFRHGANRERCDLSCCVQLTNRLPVSDRRRRGLKKALKSVKLSSSSAFLQDVWNIVADNLKKKHDVEPVHTLIQLQELIELFPDNIFIKCALVEGRAVAGVVLFNSRRVWHAQYIAANDEGYAVSALDAVFDSLLKEAAECSAEYFDFGTSNEERGLILNSGLYQYKSEYGGAGVSHEHYLLSLHQ